MELVGDIAAEVLFKLLAEGFVGFTSSVFLHGKKLSEKTMKIMRAVLTLIGLLMFVSIVVGIIMLAEAKGKSIAGVILTGIGALYFIICVVFRLVFAKRGNKGLHD